MRAKKVSLGKRKLKGGVSYYLDWYDERGQRQRRSLGFISEQAALIELHRKELELLGIETDDTRKHTNFELFVQGKYLPDYEMRKQAKSYIKLESVCRNHLFPFFGHLSLETISARHVAEYQLARLRAKRKPSNSTINIETTYLKSIINKALEWKIIRTKELGKYEKLAVVTGEKAKAFSLEQLQQIYDKTESPHWWKLFANTGIRLGEALRLRWDHVIDDSHIIIQSTNIQPTKGKKTREIPLFKGAAEALEVFAKDKQKETDFVFPRVNEKYISDYAIREIKRAGLVGSCHMFRHTFGTILCKFGANVDDVRLALGHTKLIVTQQYLHGDPTNIKNQFDLNI